MPGSSSARSAWRPRSRSSSSCSGSSEPATGPSGWRASAMADGSLLRSFRFQVKLRKSAGGAAAAGVSASAVASASVSAVAGIGGPAGDLLGDGGFQECTGLEIEQDVQDIVPGGDNARIVKRVGHAKYQNIVLKRGMFFAGGAVNADLWRWIQNVVNNVRPVDRYDGTIEVMDVGEVVVATWTFSRGLPARIRGPTLNAQTGEVAIEELHIAHEGLRLGGV